ncbi:lymphocyte antigen 6E-like [Astyanax mexicanus]|uniref:Lymphocyte antigen 6E-like n=2 Tax=Astyanax mexicanus TaxID=7994 RepID=A0A8T2LYP8_ASTMX|nr:lymphocyte antigen 6E-like [Astyanax mexicanus]
MGTLSGLLFFLLTLHSVNSLKCYVCSSTDSNEYCNSNSEECQAPLDTCMTTLSISGDLKAIVKHCSNFKVCSAAASSVSLDENGDGTAVTCCSSRLCNYSAATHVQLCTWILTLPVCVLAILMKQTA